MTSNQILNLPAGAFIKRKTHRDGEPNFGMVLEEADGYSFVVAWEQESCPWFNHFDIVPEQPELSDTEWQNTVRWLIERVPVYSEHHKTWWRNWKRVA